MKVKRTVTVDTDAFKVGDIIEIKLTDGVKAEAMAMKQEEDGMIFCLVDCLPNEYQMNSTGTSEGGYEESYLRKKLNCEILNLFPTELKATMVPFDNGDLLLLPTEREIFGKNQYGGGESPDVKQWEPMKKRRNRMAFDGSKDECRQCYGDIGEIQFSGAAVFYNDNWYWYSELTQAILWKYGKCEDMLIDDAIEITAWMPFPEPYKEEQK